MSSKINPKPSVTTESEPQLRRSTRNKSRSNNDERHLIENSNTSLNEPSPLSTRSLRSKYVRKPLSEYGKSSSSSDKQVERDNEYTKILPHEEDESEFSKDNERSNHNSPFSSYHEGPKLSTIPNAENSNIHNAMSPPIGSCKTSSPVNSTELFDAPTSAIVGPVARSSRYHSQSSTYSHDESYISTRSERRSRVNNSNTVTQRSIHTETKPSTDLLERDGTNQTNISKKDTDLSAARKRHENIKRFYENHETQKQEWMATFLNSMGVIVAILVIAWLIYNRQSYDNSPHPRNNLTQMAMRKLKNQFPSQTNATWKVIASNIQRIQRKKSNQAACIVFVHKSSTSKGTERCIATNVAKEIAALKNKNDPVTPASDNITLESKQFRSNRAGLHSTLENSLSRNSAITLFDINHLDGSTAMALHSFCDSDPSNGEDPALAPYVHTAVLTTIEDKDTNDKNELGQPKESAYSLALRELTSRWSEEIGDDKAASLISRVALNAVYLEPETPTVIQKACPVV